jgi:hypothetical protein
VQTFHLGINCHQVDALRIGQTALSAYQGVSLSARGLPGNSYSQGLPSINVDTVAGGLLDAVTAPGPWVVRTTSAGTVRLVVDIEASLYRTNPADGAWRRFGCDLNIQYRAVGTTTWVNMPSGTARVDENGVVTPSPVGTMYLASRTPKPYRVSVHLDVPSGQYEVRVRKATVNFTDSSGANVVQWVQLRSFQGESAVYPGQSVLGMVIKASGQLSGSVDELNGVLTAKPCPHWTGSAWATATNRTNGLSNPGTILLAYARGFYDENGRLLAGLGWPDSRINIDNLKAFTVWCTQRGFTFDLHLQEPTSHEELMANIAYAGLATIDLAIDGRVAVQWLDPDAPVEGVINMGNIKAKSFSVQYDPADRADELEYGYFDRAKGNAWTALRVLAPGVTIPRSTARLQNTGITSEAHAALLARHAMAQNIYMAKAISFEQDLEYMTYRRGTVLALSHDLTQWGYSGRLQGITNAAGVVTLQLDDEVPALSPSGGASRFIGLRLLGERAFRVFQVQAFEGAARAVTLVGSWPAGVPLPGASGQVHDVLWIYDFKATPGQRVVVSRIEPGDSQAGARVTVVPLPAEFWPYVLTGAYQPPPNNSLLTQAAATVRSAVVTEVLSRQGNTFATELDLSITVGNNTASVQVWGTTGGGLLTLLGSTSTGEFDWTGGLDDVWQLRLVPFNGLGQAGEAYTLTYTVVGLRTPPGNVLGLTLQVESGGVRAAWTPADDVDYSETLLRSGALWGNAIDLARKAASSHLLPWQPAGLLQVWAAHQDTTGNQSATPASAVLTVRPPPPVRGLALAVGNTGLLATWAMDATPPGLLTFTFGVLLGVVWDYADEPEATQPVDRVELSWDAGFGQVIDAKRGTTATFDWQGTGGRTLYARVVDVAGNAGTVVSTTLAVTAPAAVRSLLLGIGNTGLQASWAMPPLAATAQPVDRVELAWDAGFVSVIDAKRATAAAFDWVPAGARTLYVRCVDVAGNVGAVASAALTVLAPSAPVGLEIRIGTASVEALWQAPAVSAVQQPLDRVELAWTEDFANVIDGKRATTATFGWQAAGTHTLYARYVDAYGNVGAVSQAMLQVLAPAQPVMTAVETQVNAVTLRWQDAKTSQPIRKYAIWYGDGGTPFAQTLLYGAAGADSRSDILFYRSSGAKVAFLVAEDVAGNLSTPRQVDVSISMPNDFVLATEYYHTWDSVELENAQVVGGPTGQVVLPANVGRTWGERLSNNNWTTAQEKVDAGFPLVVQPVPLNGKHVERHDVGKLLATAVVRVRPTVQSQLAGATPQVRIRASDGNTDTAWQPWLVGDAASFANFRHIEVEYSVASDGAGFVVLDDLYVSVEVSELNESGTLVLDPTDTNGTPFVPTKPFLDIKSAQITVQGVSAIARPPHYVIDDSGPVPKVLVFAFDATNNRTGGTVAISISGVTV